MTSGINKTKWTTTYAISTRVKTKGEIKMSLRNIIKRLSLPLQVSTLFILERGRWEEFIRIKLVIFGIISSNNIIWDMSPLFPLPGYVITTPGNPRTSRPRPNQSDYSYDQIRISLRTSPAIVPRSRPVTCRE